MSSDAYWLGVHDGKAVPPDPRQLPQDRDNVQLMEAPTAAGHFEENGYAEVEEFLDSQQRLMDAQRAQGREYRELEFVPAPFQFYDNMDAHELHRATVASYATGPQQARAVFNAAGGPDLRYIPQQYHAGGDAWGHDGQQRPSAIPPEVHRAIPMPASAGGDPPLAPNLPRPPHASTPRRETDAVRREPAPVAADAPPRAESDQGKKKRGRSTTQSQVNKDSAGPKKLRASTSRAPKATAAAAAANKENIDGPDDESAAADVIDLDDDLGDIGDSDVDLDEDDTSAASTPGGKWVYADRSLLYEYILGPDADEIWATLQVNRVHVFRKAVTELKFQGSYTAEAARKHFGRALKTFRAINNALGTTGGAGDVDLHDHKGAITYFNNCIKSARARSENIGKLTSKTMELWHNMKWTELFRSRYGKDARMVRAVKLSSGAPIAPLPESTNNTPSSPTKPLSAAQTVSEPKHRGKAKPDAPAGMSELHEIVKQKVQNDEERGKAREAEAKERLEIERERLKLDKAREENQMRLEFLKAASTSTVLSEEVKERMNNWVGSLFN